MPEILRLAGILSLNSVLIVFVIGSGFWQVVNYFLLVQAGVMVSSDSISCTRGAVPMVIFSRFKGKRSRDLALVGYFFLIHLILAIFATSIFSRQGDLKSAGGGSNSDQYIQRILRYHQWIDEQIPEKSIVFLGDSLTQGLATAAIAPNATNFGIGGQTTSGLLNALPAYKSVAHAKLIFLEIGINDFLEDSTAGLNDRVKNISAILPAETPLVWSSVMPAKTEKYSRRDIAEINSVIRSVCEQRTNCRYLDTWSFLASADGPMVSQDFLPDGVHLSPEGYRKWIAALKQAVPRELGEQPRAM
jgi:lysophospholipase L1-like esterase